MQQAGVVPSSNPRRLLLLLLQFHRDPVAAAPPIPGEGDDGGSSRPWFPAEEDALQEGMRGDGGLRGGRWARMRDDGGLRLSYSGVAPSCLRPGEQRRRGGAGTAEQRRALNTLGSFGRNRNRNRKKPKPNCSVLRFSRNRTVLISGEPKFAKKPKN